MYRPRVKADRKPRPRIMLVPRKRYALDPVQHTPAHALAALRMNPMDRTAQDVDAILAIVGKWPDFTKFVRTEQERREICGRITAEDYDQYQIVIKERDQPDGWYLILSGRCSIYKMNPDADPSLINPNMLQSLRSAFGHDKKFAHLAVKNATEEFGSTSLTNNDVRNATVVADVKSIILRVDPHLYREIVAWFAKNQLKKKTSLLSHVKELAFLKAGNKVVMSRLADYMEQIRLEPGTVIDEKYFDKDEPDQIGFYVVEEGLLGKHRLVDFSKMRLHQEDYEFKVPRGIRNLRVSQYTAGDMFPDPGMIECVKHPFTLVVEESAVIWCLKKKDMAAMLLTLQLEKVYEEFDNEPTDMEVMEAWIEKQAAIQWAAFKQRCVKDARRVAKNERRVANGDWTLRRNGLPKAIKDHAPSAPLSRLGSPTK